MRRLMRGRKIETAEQPEEATRADYHPRQLVFLLDGTADLRKGGVHHLSGPCFPGEIAFVTDGPASADVWVTPGSRYVAWPFPHPRANVTRRHRQSRRRRRMLSPILRLPRHGTK